jgi:hypothetical protein
MQIHISTSAQNQRILSKIALLSKAFEMSIVEVKNTKTKKSPSADDYRKAAVMNGKRILSKRMVFE